MQTAYISRHHIYSQSVLHFFCCWWWGQVYREGWGVRRESCLQRIPFWARCMFIECSRTEQLQALGTRRWSLAPLHTEWQWNIPSAHLCWPCFAGNGNQFLVLPSTTAACLHPAVVPCSDVQGESCWGGALLALHGTEMALRRNKTCI